MASGKEKKISCKATVRLIDAKHGSIDCGFVLLKSKKGNLDQAWTKLTELINKKVKGLAEYQTEPKYDIYLVTNDKEKNEKVVKNGNELETLLRELAVPKSCDIIVKTKQWSIGIIYGESHFDLSFVNKEDITYDSTLFSILSKLSLPHNSKNNIKIFNNDKEIGDSDSLEKCFNDDCHCELKIEFVNDARGATSTTASRRASKEHEDSIVSGFEVNTNQFIYVILDSSGGTHVDNGASFKWCPSYLRNINPGRRVSEPLQPEENSHSQNQGTTNTGGDNNGDSDDSDNESSVEIDWENEMNDLKSRIKRCFKFSDANIKNVIMYEVESSGNDGSDMKEAIIDTPQSLECVWEKVKDSYDEKKVANATGNDEASTKVVAYGKLYVKIPQAAFIDKPLYTRKQKMDNNGNSKNIAVRLAGIGIKLAKLKMTTAENEKYPGFSSDKLLRQVKELFQQTKTTFSGSEEETNEYLPWLCISLRDISELIGGMGAIDILRDYLQLFGFDTKEFILGANSDDEKKEDIVVTTKEASHHRFEIQGKLKRESIEEIDNNFSLINAGFNAYQRNDLQWMLLHGQRVYDDILRLLNIDPTKCDEDNNNVVNHETGVYNNNFITFRLQQLELENRDSEFVTKSLLPPENIERFINFLSPNASKDNASKIDFVKCLSDTNIKSIGVFGTKEHICQTLLKLGFADESMCKFFSKKDGGSSLKPGIHAIVAMNESIHPTAVRLGLGLGSENENEVVSCRVVLFYWPVDHAFSSPDMNLGIDGINRSNISCIYIRTLHEICDCVVIPSKMDEVRSFMAYKRSKYTAENKEDDKEEGGSSSSSDDAQITATSVQAAKDDVNLIGKEWHLKFEEIPFGNDEKEREELKNAFVVNGLNGSSCGYQFIAHNCTTTTEQVFKYFQTVDEMRAYCVEMNKTHGFIITAIDNDKWKGTAWQLFAQTMNSELYNEYQRKMKESKAQHEAQVEKAKMDLNKEKEKNEAIAKYHFSKYYLDKTIKPPSAYSSHGQWQTVWDVQIDNETNAKEVNEIREALSKKFAPSTLYDEVKRDNYDANILILGAKIYTMNDEFDSAYKQYERSKNGKNGKNAPGNGILATINFHGFSHVTTNKINHSNEVGKTDENDGSAEVQFARQWLSLYEKYETEYLKHQHTIDINGKSLEKTKSTQLTADKNKKNEETGAWYKGEFDKHLAKLNENKKLKFYVKKIDKNKNNASNATWKFSINAVIERNGPPSQNIRFMTYDIHGSSIHIDSNQNKNNNNNNDNNSNNNGNNNLPTMKTKVMDNVQLEMKGYEKLVYFEMLQLQHILVVSNLNEKTHVYYINGFTSNKITEFPKKSDLATYAEKHQILAVYNRKEQKIGFYVARKTNNVISKFDISPENDAIELRSETWNRTSNFHIKHMKLDDSTKRLIIIDNTNILRIYDLINRSWYCNEDRDSLPLGVNVGNCLLTQDGAFLLVLSDENENENENENDKNGKKVSQDDDNNDHNQELKNDETDNSEGDTLVTTYANVGENAMKKESTRIVMTVVLLDDLDTLKQISLADSNAFSINNIDKICLKYVRMKNDLGNESRASIAVLDNNGKDLYVQLLDVSVSSSKLQFRVKTNDNANNDKSKKHRKYTKLDYLTFMMDKFGSKPVFYQNSSKDLLEFNTCLLIDSKTLSQNEEIANKEMKLCKKACKKSCDIVRDECKKDFSLLQWNNEAIAVDFDSGTNYLNFDYLINQCKLKQNGCLLSKFIINIIIQFPIQIGHTAGGKFVIMYNGEDNQSEYIHGCDTASEWRDKISFGGYDAIISNWNGPIRVVSSMGKQSTGKSYFLNHLFGSKFETSGARCTDGAWMTVRICKGINNTPEKRNDDNQNEIDILYIIMDFEGLGTYERTEQEDTTLAVFNSSISNCTIFRSENRLGPELTTMFQRFQNGVNQLGGDKSLFQGCLLMTIKDIPPSDRESVKNEFMSKFQQFVAETDKTNEKKDESNSFLLHMYKQKPNLVIKPYPPLSSDKFFPQMIKFKNKYIDPSKIVHDKGGTIFLQHMKLLMAKLAMSDFSDLAGQMAQTRIDSLQGDIEAGVSYGSLNVVSEDDMAMEDENAVTLGASTNSYFASVNERLAAIRMKVADEKQLFVIETKEKINISHYAIIDEWARDNMNSSNKYVKSIAKQIQSNAIDDGSDSKEEQKNNKTLKEEYLNLLNFVRDDGLLLSEMSINEQLFVIFEDMMPHLKRKHGNGLNVSFYGFEAFLSMLFIRRRNRIMKWIKCNTDRFVENEEKQIVNKFIDRSIHLLSKLAIKLDLCGNECMADGSQCKFLCLLPKDHATIVSPNAIPGYSPDLTGHDCFGSHKCEEMCDYCKDCKEKIDSSSLLQSCHYAAGHDGKHDCKISTMKNHSCDRQCSLRNTSGKQYLNCKGTCSKTYNHFDENKNDACVCDAKHLCGESCGASLCGRACIIPYDKDHKVHDCGRKECLHKCEVKCGDPMNNDSEPIDCGEPCKCENHFHDSAIKNKTLKQNEVNFHCCMKEHDCGEKCGESGNCGVKNFKSSTTVVREYKSKSGRKIQYAAWTTTANAYKKSCNHKIPVGEKSHDGKHMCNSNKHTCDVKCPQCLYYCEEEYGHNKNNSKSLHSIQNHGNMRNTVFMSDESKFQVNHEKLNEMKKGGKDDNKDEEKSNSNVNLLRVYQRNDEGTAEMCHNFCVTQGRGHVHLISCKEWERSDKTEAVDGQKCEQRYTYDGKIYGRHAPPDKYGEGRDDLDEIKHAQYWSKYLKFKDPVIYKKQRKPFGKCNHFCGAPGHDNDKEKSYCVKGLWHEKVKEEERSENQTLNQGHLFNCKHAEPHIVFMLDDSGSMSSGDWKPSLALLAQYETNVSNILGIDSLLGRTTLNNRMGSVLEALIKFLVARQSQGYNDKFTVMFHGKTTITLCERVNLASLDGSRKDKEIVNYIERKCFDKVRWGDTNFGEAMFEAQQLIEKYKDDQFIVIFLTDGDCDDGYAKHDKKLTASERVKYLKETYEKFSFCAIQFGPDKISPTLQKMVKAGGGNIVETAKIPSGLQQIFSIAVKKETDIVLKYNNNNA